MTRPAKSLLMVLAAAGLVYAAGKLFGSSETRPRKPSRADSESLRVVIVGAGFGGMEAARQLAYVPGIDLTVLDQQNHHLFQPLLYQVATAALSAEDIASPIRDLLAGGATVRMERVTDVDTERREVVCGTNRIPYEALVIATGSQPSYFGHPTWSKFAPGLKTLDEALSLRSEILSAFEQAARATRDADRERWLTFVLIGGGPTGVEMAGSIAELAKDMLSRDYPHLQRKARVIIVESGKTLLAHFKPSQSRYTETQLRRMGVELRLGVEVTDIKEGRLKLGDEELTAGVVIWAAGVEATPAAKWLGVTPSHGGRVAVGPDLEVKEHPGIYVIGDAALALGPDGEELPGLAAVAKQQGCYVGRSIRDGLGEVSRRVTFSYRDYGSLATIGRNRAVADIGPVRLTGFPAWLFWASVHLWFLNGFRNRALVSAEWLLSYMTHRRHGRILVDRFG